MFLQNRLVLYRFAWREIVKGDLRALRDRISELPVDSTGGGQESLCY